VGCNVDSRVACGRAGMEGDPWAICGIGKIDICAGMRVWWLVGRLSCCLYHRSVPIHL
jgi:hypothetical protein